MAKSKSFFGLRTGSTKSLTFSVYRGTQVTKDRVTRVANPRTVAQMQQRAKVPLVAAARAALAGLVDHSFEGVPYGQASLQRFSSLNLANGALNVASYPPNGVSNMGCADFIVSHGSLLNPFKSVDSNMHAAQIALPTLGDAKVFPEMPVGTKGSTVAYFANKAFAHNPAWRENSQLTGLVLVNQFNYVISNFGGNSMQRTVPLFMPHIERFVFPDSYPANDQTVDGLKDYYDDNDYWKLKEAVPAGGADAVTLEGPNGEKLGITFDQSRKHAQISMTPAFEENYLVAGCLIFSQLDGTTWKRSNERLKLANGIVWKTVIPFTFTDWMQAYTGSVVTTKYLNTGDAATGISGQQRPPRRD